MAKQFRTSGVFNLGSLGSDTATYVSSNLVMHIDAGNTSSYPGSGTTVTDIEGSNRTMTLSGGVTYQTANGGQFDFDGSNDYMSTSTSGLSTGTVAFSLELWVNFDQYQTTRWWLAVIGQYSQGAVHLIGRQGANITRQYGVWGGGAGSQIGGVIGASAGDWQQIVITHDGTSTLKLYENNTLINTATSASALNFTNDDLHIGKRAGSESYFDGKMTILRLYDRELTAAEVQNNYDADKARHGLSSGATRRWGGLVGRSLIASDQLVKTGNLKLSELFQAKLSEPTLWDGTVEYLIVAGGGSGGGDNGGAGGGGGVLTGTSLQLASGTGLTFKVGRGAVRNTGGPGNSGDNSPGTNGDNSQIGTLIAYGGGGGGCGDTNEVDGLNGGTGGGGGSESGKGNGSGGTGTSGQGYAGGGGLFQAGGGGGGAGEAGTSPTASNAPGNGGDGVQSSITGTATYYGGGGGGGTQNYQTAVSGSALGGQGGGGQGGLGSTPDDGTDHLGGGGGGAGYTGGGSYPGKGGSGVVIVKFPSNSGYTLSQFQGEFNSTTGLSFTDHGNGAYEVRLSNTGATISKTWTPNF